MKIIIVGAGGFGRELLEWIKDINKIERKWEIAGFIDDNLGALDNLECDARVIGKISEWQPKEDEEFALAVASPCAKRKIVKMITDKGGKFANIVHPTAIIAPNAIYGKGLVMFPYAKLSVNSCVGDYVTLLSSGVGHDVKIGDYTTVSGMCSVLRNVVIENDVFVAAGVQIENDVIVEKNSYLGIGSVVLKNVPKNSKVFGNPARIVPK